jgi:hypothetical protein
MSQPGVKPLHCATGGRGRKGSDAVQCAFVKDRDSCQVALADIDDADMFSDSIVLVV